MSKRYPQNDECTKFLAWPEDQEITLHELVKYATSFFPHTGPREIKIDRMEIQVDCFGYDLYDPVDYVWYYVFSI